MVVLAATAWPTNAHLIEDCARLGCLDAGVYAAPAAGEEAMCKALTQHEWEVVWAGAESCEETKRMAVPGGWLYRHVIRAEATSVAVTFVPRLRKPCSTGRPRGKSAVVRTMELCRLRGPLHLGVLCGELGMARDSLRTSLDRGVHRGNLVRPAPATYDIPREQHPLGFGCPYCGEKEKP